MMDNPYLPSIHGALPRLLSLLDTDQTSDSYGFGDRSFWAWGLIDFANGTFQGAAHGMARLWSAGLWPYATEAEDFLSRIDAIFLATERLTRSDGSLEEAFPFEGSFCVSALVAFDLLCAIDLLKPYVSAEVSARWRSVVEPLIAFLNNTDETHAIISNHLATAVAALARWHKLSGDAKSGQRAESILGRILEHQSSEGWFEEYGGADPGYQSLCTYYLADAHNQRPDWGLHEPLAKSMQFLRYFVHPDGSFGGLYGSRNTRFYHPAGFEALANEIDDARSIADFMAESIRRKTVVTLDCMDEPNLIPMFNAYCWAAELRATRTLEPATHPLPAVLGRAERVHYPETGLLVDIGPAHYSVINTHKGGVLTHFRNGRRVVDSAGVVIEGPGGKLGSSQAFNPDNKARIDESSLIVEAAISPMAKRLPTPASFLVLRLLCLSLFRFRSPREWTKRLLVRLLITRRSNWPASNRRHITLGPELCYTDETEVSPGYRRIEGADGFVAIHMASQGYWQIQDEHK